MLEENPVLMDTISEISKGKPGKSYQREQIFLL